MELLVDVLYLHVLHVALIVYHLQVVIIDLENNSEALVVVEADHVIGLVEADLLLVNEATREEATLVQLILQLQMIGQNLHFSSVLGQSNLSESSFKRNYKTSLSLVSAISNPYLISGLKILGHQLTVKSEVAVKAFNLRFEDDISLLNGSNHSMCVKEISLDDSNLVALVDF